MNEFEESYHRLKKLWTSLVYIGGFYGKDISCDHYYQEHDPKKRLDLVIQDLNLMGSCIVDVLIVHSDMSGMIDSYNHTTTELSSGTMVVDHIVNRLNEIFPKSPPNFFNYNYIIEYRESEKGVLIYMGYKVDSLDLYCPHFHYIIRTER